MTLRHLPRLTLLLMLLSALLLSGCNRALRGDDLDRISMEELYERSSQELRNNNFSRSERFLKRLIARFPFGPTSEQATLKLAYAQYRLDKYDEAQATVNRFIKTYPTHPNVDYAYYVRGLINFDRNPGFVNSLVRGDEALRDQSFSKQSFLDFGELLKRFPNSQYATDARQRMLYLRNNLAIYELSVARYYLRRGANVGAIGRARFILETYQETPMAADALAVMVQAYENLGETQLAADTLTVLRASSPSHPYITGEADPGRQGWIRKLWPFGKGRAP